MTEKVNESDARDTLTLVTAITAMFIVTLNPNPDNIQNVVEQLDNFETPEGDSSQALQIQEMYGNIIAHGIDRWQKITGKKFEQRSPLNKEQDTFKL